MDTWPNMVSTSATAAFEADLDAFALVAAGEAVCRASARIGEVLGT